MFDFYITDSMHCATVTDFDIWKNCIAIDESGEVILVNRKAGNADFLYL